MCKARSFFLSVYLENGISACEAPCYGKVLIYFEIVYMLLEKDVGTQF